MEILQLRYVEDDVPNQTGELEVIFEAHGYRAAASTYVAASSLATFGRSLRVYPLREGASFETLEVGLAVRPLGSLGRLVVTGKLESVTGRNSLPQTATLQLETDYSSIETFARRLIAVAGQKAAEASLQGNG